MACHGRLTCSALCVCQAENELGHEWTLMRAGTPGTPSTGEWLKDVLPEGARVGIDPVSLC